MKVGTASKITVGTAALIAIIFIGYIGIRQMNAPTVEERVYLSPWEDGTARPQNSYVKAWLPKLILLKGQNSQGHSATNCLDRVRRREGTD